MDEVSENDNTIVLGRKRTGRRLKQSPGGEWPEVEAATLTSVANFKCSIYDEILLL